MNAKAQLKIDYINGLQPLTFTDDEQIRDHFMGLYKATHAGVTDDMALDFHNRESFYFKQLLTANRELLSCTMFSLYGSFMDIVVNGLSFDPASNLIYITPKSVNIAANGQQPLWEKRAKNTVSPYGELALRIKANQIKYVDDPVIVYEGDTWEPGYNELGFRYCLYKTKLPRSNNKIIGSFIKITRNDGSIDFPFFSVENINEWKAASQKQNKNNGANALYSSNEGQITIGFLKAKTIRHSFKTYPKIKIVGSNTELEEGDFEATAINSEIPASQPLQASIQPATLPPLQQQLQPPPATPPAFTMSSAPPPVAVAPQYVNGSQPSPEKTVVIDDPNSPF